MSEDNADFAPVDPVRAGLSASCPRCGEGRLFDGLTTIKARCTNCDLDYTFADAGDGPVVFVILLANIIVVGLAVWTEINFKPTILLHVLLWGPLAIGLSIWLLRTIKALLIALQFRHNASQGTIDRG